MIFNFTMITHVRALKRWFGVTFIACFLGLLCIISNAHAQRQTNKPNIIYLFTDQQNSKMMSCAGNPSLQTPAMDYLANHGVRFTKTYVTNPDCSPSRISMMTGRFPSALQTPEGKPILENQGAMKVTNVAEGIKNSFLPAYLKKAGYNFKSPLYQGVMATTTFVSTLSPACRC
jgi:choline-sulfatase